MNAYVALGVLIFLGILPPIAHTMISLGKWRRNTPYSYTTTWGAVFFTCFPIWWAAFGLSFMDKPIFDDGSLPIEASQWTALGVATLYVVNFCLQFLPGVEVVDAGSE